MFLVTFLSIVLRLILRKKQCNIGTPENCRTEDRIFLVAAGSYNRLSSWSISFIQRKQWTVVAFPNETWYLDNSVLSRMLDWVSIKADWLRSKGHSSSCEPWMGIGREGPLKIFLETEALIPVCYCYVLNIILLMISRAPDKWWG